MLELKFAIYYRAASLPSPASSAVLAEESHAFFKHSPHTNSISNSAILRNNYISLLSDLCACVHVKKEEEEEEEKEEWEEEEEEERKTIWPSGDFLVRYFRDAF